MITLKKLYYKIKHYFKKRDSRDSVSGNRSSICKDHKFLSTREIPDDVFSKNWGAFNIGIINGEFNLLYLPSYSSLDV